MIDFSFSSFIIYAFKIIIFLLRATLAAFHNFYLLYCYYDKVFEVLYLIHDFIVDPSLLRISNGIFHFHSFGDFLLILLLLFLI